MLCKFLALAGAFDKGLKMRPMSLPDRFIDQDTPEKMYEAAGLDAKAIVAVALDALGHPDRNNQAANTACAINAMTNEDPALQNGPPRPARATLTDRRPTGSLNGAVPNGDVDAMFQSAGTSQCDITTGQSMLRQSR